MNDGIHAVQGVRQRLFVTNIAHAQFETICSAEDQKGLETIDTLVEHTNGMTFHQKLRHKCRADIASTARHQTFIIYSVAYSPRLHVFPACARDLIYLFQADCPRLDQRLRVRHKKIGDFLNP